MPTYYINADTGNNGNTGGSGDPWLTLAYAITNSASGDTIICQDSTATYSFTTQSITDRTIQGEQDNASGAIFDGGGTSAYWTINGTVAISKITIQNIAAGFSTITMTVQASSSLTMINCIVANCTLRAYGTTGAFIGNRSVIFPSSFTLQNILFYNIDLDTSVTGGSLIGLRNWTNSQTVTMTGCTIVVPSATYQIDGIFNWNGCNNDVIVKNCIIDNQSGGTVSFATNASSGTTTMTYTNTHNITSPPSGTGNITSDPLFADAANSDFRLQRDSPAIATGVLV